RTKGSAARSCASRYRPAPIAVVCNCGFAANAQGRALRRMAAAGLFAAIGVCGACCLLPFILLSVGIGGIAFGYLEPLLLD
ncbi:MAG: hypothetical protein AB7K73_15135, partial [Gammaproteobacteria bacterium]